MQSIRSQMSRLRGTSHSPTRRRQGGSVSAPRPKSRASTSAAENHVRGRRRQTTAAGSQKSLLRQEKERGRPLSVGRERRSQSAPRSPAWVESAKDILSSERLTEDEFTELGELMSSNVPLNPRENMRVKELMRKFRQNSGGHGSTQQAPSAISEEESDSFTTPPSDDSATVASVGNSKAPLKKTKSAKMKEEMAEKDEAHRREVDQLRQELLEVKQREQELLRATASKPFNEDSFREYSLEPTEEQEVGGGDRREATESQQELSEAVDRLVRFDINASRELPLPPPPLLSSTRSRSIKLSHRASASDSVVARRRKSIVDFASQSNAEAAMLAEDRLVAILEVKKEEIESVNQEILRVEHEVTQKRSRLIRIQVAEALEDIVCQIEDLFHTTLPGPLTKKHSHYQFFLSEGEEAIKNAEEDLEKTSKELESAMERKNQEIANLTSQIQLDRSGSTTEDDKLLQWLTSKLKKNQGFDDDELKWQYAAENGLIENSYLKAEEEERRAQQDYINVTLEKDLFDRLYRLLKKNPAIEALEKVTKAVDDGPWTPPDVGFLRGGSLKSFKEAKTSLKPGPAAAAAEKLKDDPRYAKYFKMLALHLPRGAVEAKMRAEGVDSKVLDMDPEGPPPGQANSEPTSQVSRANAGPSSSIKLKDDPKFAKYFKMLAMHLPRTAVEMKMEAEGQDPKVLDMDPDGPSPNSNKQSGGMKLKDDPMYAKYFKMLSMHLPRPAVAMKMQAEGQDPKVLDMDPEGPSPNSNKQSGGTSMKLKDDPMYAKYFKMLSMHLPRPAVVMKMQAEGQDPKVLDMDPEGPSPNTAPPSSSVPLKDDPMYAKYFKMLSMHLPRPAVEQKARADGVDPSFLDLDPNAPAPNNSTTAMSDSASATPAVPVDNGDLLAQIKAGKQKKQKKALTVKAALKGVEKALNGPRGAMKELESMGRAASDERFRIIVASLEHVLEQGAVSGEAARQASAAEVSTLKDTTEQYAQLCKELEVEAEKIETEIEKWTRRMQEAPEKAEVEGKRERKWAESQREQNERALELMRSYVPTDVRLLTNAMLIQKAADRGFFYTHRLSRRLRKRKLLHWLITHPDDIVNANFLIGASRDSFLNLQDYDLMELRAVFTILPHEFNLDSDGAKRKWREYFVKTLKDLVAIEESRKPSTQSEDGEESATPVPDSQQLKKIARAAEYSYQATEEIDRLRRERQERVERVEALEGSVEELTDRVEKAQQAFNRSLTRFNDKELQRTIGKDALRDEKNRLKVDKETVEKELRATREKAHRSRRELENQAEALTKAHAEEEAVKSQGLCGQNIPPAFEANPTLEKAKGAVKKLSDEEEAALRAKEIAALQKSRTGINESASNTGLAAQNDQQPKAAPVHHPGKLKNAAFAAELAKKLKPVG